jgi:hypothetical protein
MMMYIVCVMSFIWRTGTTDDAKRGPMTPNEAFTFRILLTVVLSLGLLYFVLIASTLRKYGEMMDQAWHRRIMGWFNDAVAEATYTSARIVPSNLVQEHNSNTGNTNRPVISRSAPPSWDEDHLNRGLNAPRDVLLPPPRPPLLPTPAPSTLPLHSLVAIPGGDMEHKFEVDSNKRQEPIKLGRILSLSFGDGNPPHVPPSEDELKTWHMTAELWQELRTVSNTTL